MKKNIVLYLLLWSVSAVFATDVTPILVFHKDGKIDYFKSDQFVEIKTLKSDNTEAAYYQSFVLKDTVVNIAVADIDSVAFGNRHSIIPKAGVKRITEQELTYISAYSNGVMTYGKDCPTEMIPTEGMKIYHDAFCDVFPYGICAKVNAVTRSADKTEVAVTEVDPAEVFDEYLVTGDVEMAIPVAALTAGGMKHLPEGDELNFGFENTLSASSFSLNAGGYAVLRFDNFVGSLTRHYYHCDIDVSYETDMAVEYKSTDSTDEPIELRSPTITLYQNPLALISPKLELGLFADFEAEMQIGLKMHRTFSTHVEWTRQNGEDVFVIDGGGNESQDVNEASIEFILNGTLHLGVLADLSLGILFNNGGVGARSKIGPCFEGEFGFGMLNDLTQDYDVDLYAKAKIDASVLVKMETYAYYRDIIWMNEHEIALPFNANLKMFTHTWNLLPEFSTKSVRRNLPADTYVPSSPESTAESRMKASTKIAKDLEVGVQIEHKDKLEVVPTLFDGKVYQSNTEDMQVFDSQVPLGNEPTDNLLVYPVVKYGESIVKGAPTTIADGAVMAQTFYQYPSNGVYAVAGAPVVHQQTSNGTTFIVGNIMPIANVASDEDTEWKRPFTTVGFIESNTIFGTWVATIDGQTYCLMLSSDYTCTYNGLQGHFNLNYPQDGIVQMTFDNDAQLCLSILDLTSNTMTVVYANDDKEVTFNREK